MGANIQHDQLIASYLSGGLTEQERQQVEEKYFTDPAFLEQMQAVEAELMEDYVRGALPRDQAEKLEQRLLASAHQRRKVELAHSLLRALEEETEPAPLPIRRSGKNWWEAALSLIRPDNFLSRIALATAAAAILLGGGWLVFEVSRLRQQVGQMQQEQAAARQREQALQEMIARQQTPGDQANHNPQPAPEGQHTEARRPAAPSVSAPDPHLASFLLSPVLVRGEPQMPKELAISADTRAVRLQLRYDGEGHRKYRAVLETADGDEVWSRTGFQASRSGGRKFVNVVIPAGLFENRTYNLTLRPATGAEEDLSRYTFEIIRK